MGLYRKLWGAIAGQPFWTFTLASGLILMAAFIFQAFGYYPCKLCWWQRYPYMLQLGFAGLIALFGHIKGRHYGHSFSALALTGLCFLSTGGLAVYHSGVEQGYWPGPDTCSGSTSLKGELGAVLNALLAAPIIRCDEIAWSFLGLSMASYNALLGLGLGFLAVYFALQSRLHRA